MTGARGTVQPQGGRRGSGTGYKPGSVIGDYVVIGAVGAGGMGTVYKVQHVITQRIEAMKLLASGRTEPDQEQRFVREMQVQARLHHPNIAAVYNAFRYYDEFFLVMEFIEGESLESVLERGRMPLASGLHYACQALFALGYAHAHGVVHRDIAPSNMLITPEGTVKLTDFGLAKTTTDIRLTQSGTPVGSPWYMSPEQVRGDAALDARSDIYSLGAILYEITTGSKPFDLASTFDVMRAHVELPPLAPITRAPDVPETLNQIILTALAKDPNARFQSAEQFYAALEPLQAGRSPLVMDARAAAQTTRPRAAAPMRPRRASWRPSQLAKVRVMQAAVGTAACGLALFGGYATYSYVRLTSVAAQTPAIVPAKAMIPPAPEIPLGQAPVLAAADARDLADPPPATRVPEVKRHAGPIRTLAAHLSSPAQPFEREFPTVPEPPAATRIAALPAAPPIPRTPAIAAAEEPAILPAEPLPSPDPPASAPVKKGNRLFRALHKVVSFHKPGKPDAAADSAPTSETQPQ